MDVAVRAIKSVDADGRRSVMLYGFESSSGAEVNIRKYSPCNMSPSEVRRGEVRPGEVLPPERSAPVRSGLMSRFASHH